jgi:hypothetical protein
MFLLLYCFRLRHIHQSYQRAGRQLRHRRLQKSHDTLGTHTLRQRQLLLGQLAPDDMSDTRLGQSFQIADRETTKVFLLEVRRHLTLFRQLSRHRQRRLTCRVEASQPHLFLRHHRQLRHT